MNPELRHYIRQSANLDLVTVRHIQKMLPGDAELDRRLPFEEPYRISAATAHAIRRTKAEGRRIVAVGTTVVRALEHAAGRHGGLRAGEGLATQRIGPASRLRVVDAILSGTHEPDSSHYQLLRAFADGVTLQRASEALETRGYRTHEFGDSVLIERKAQACSRRMARGGLERFLVHHERSVFEIAVVAAFEDVAQPLNAAPGHAAIGFG